MSDPLAMAMLRMVSLETCQRLCSSQSNKLDAQQGSINLHPYTPAFLATWNEIIRGFMRP
jgi:hypothetical protein